MRLFIKSIQTGCHITPKLFVPKNVWYPFAYSVPHLCRFQAGAKIVAMSQKSQSWATINDGITKIKDVSRDDFEPLGKVSTDTF